MDRHYSRALIALAFILAGTLPSPSTCVAGEAAQSTKSSQEGGAETITPLPEPRHDDCGRTALASQYA